MWGDSPRISAEHKFKCASDRWDAGWVDSLPASSDITAVCGPTTDFTLFKPVSSQPCPQKMVQGNYLRSRTYDTGASFELIFMIFAGLLRVHPWVNSIVFGNNRLNRTTAMGGNVPPKPVFLLSFNWYGTFLWKKLINSMWYPIPRRKGSTHFCHPTPSLPQKWSCPPKIIFCGYFKKYVFFFLKNFYFHKMLCF